MGTFTDPQQRLSWIVEQARHRPPFPADLRTDANRVPGCAARLWLVCRLENGRCRFACDSDSAILKALAGLLCEVYDDLPPEEVCSDSATLSYSLGLDPLLTENRRRTIQRLRATICEFGERQRHQCRRRRELE